MSSATIACPTYITYQYYDRLTVMAAISAILRGNSSALASLRLSSYRYCAPLLIYVTSDEWSFYCNSRLEFDVGAYYRYHKRCCYHSQHGISPKDEREIKRCLLLLELDSTDITLHKTQDVKSSYVRLVKKYHPDKMAAMEEFEISSDSTEKFHEIHQAYEVLLVSGHLSTRLCFDDLMMVLSFVISY